MRVGIEIVNEQRQPRPSAVAGLARGAERLGYATVWVRDSPMGSARTAEAVLVAAGAAPVVRLGISTVAPQVDQLADLLRHGDELNHRLTIALPGPLLRTAESDVGRLAEVSGLLIASEFDCRDLTAVPTRGCFAAGIGPELDDARQAVDRAPDPGAELVVRLSIPSGGGLDQTIGDLLMVRAAGADEVVLAAIDEPNGDRAMAVYAALAELLETAR